MVTPLILSIFFQQNYKLYKQAQLYRDVQKKSCQSEFGAIPSCLAMQPAIAMPFCQFRKHHHLIHGTHEILIAFAYFPGTLDIPFIRQWQKTLIIFNGILLTVNAIRFLLNLLQEGLDFTDHIIGSVSMALIVAGFVKTYMKQFVCLDKI